MSFRVVRQSKFRHVFGQACKKQECYDGIRITRSSWDSSFCVVNPKFLAIITEAGGGGSFLVLSLQKVGRMDKDQGLVVGHKAEVLDLAWCPFNDHVIASASEDCTVKVWQIPDRGIGRLHLEESVVDLVAHQRRVGLVVWHPTANNVLLSSGADCKIFIWNVGTAEILTQIDCHPDIVFCAAWNLSGSLIATTCKDKKIRIIDPRTGKIKSEGKGHEGSKPQRIIFMKNGDLFTTGFSRMSERQYALRSDSCLDEPVCLEELDQSNSVLFPVYDPDTNLLYLSGKGDSNIKYFEVTEEFPYVHYISTYLSSDPQRGMGFMPKRGLNFTHNEIARLYKLHQKGLCEVISFTVPRKSELFQDDLYPDTAGPIPALTANDWVLGTDASPIMMSLKECGRGGVEPSAVSQFQVIKKPNILDRQLQQHVGGGGGGGGRQASTGGGGAAQANQLQSSEYVKKLEGEVKNLRQLVGEHEKRIKALEEALELLMAEADV